MRKDNNCTQHMMVYYKIKMTLSAFRTLVQFEQAHVGVKYTQILMIGTTDFVSRP